MCPILIDAQYGTFAVDGVVFRDVGFSAKKSPPARVCSRHHRRWSRLSFLDEFER